MVRAGLIGGERYRGTESVERRVIASSHRLLDELDTRSLQLRQEPLEERS